MKRGTNRWQSLLALGLLAIFATSAEAGVRGNIFRTTVETGAPGGSRFCFNYGSDGSLVTSGLGTGTFTEIDLFLFSFFTINLTTGGGTQGNGISIFNFLTIGSFTNGPSFSGVRDLACIPDPLPRPEQSGATIPDVPPDAPNPDAEVTRPARSTRSF